MGACQVALVSLGVFRFSIFQRPFIVADGACEVPACFERDAQIPMGQCGGWLDLDYHAVMVDRFLQLSDQLGRNPGLILRRRAVGNQLGCLDRQAIRLAELAPPGFRSASCRARV